MKKSLIIGFLGLILSISWVLAVEFPGPPIPSEWWGTVLVDGSPPAAGTLVTAEIGGEVYATGQIIEIGPDSFFDVIIPGNETGTPGNQGGVEGDTIVLKVDGNPADPTMLWTSGSNDQQNVTVILIIISEIPLREGWNLISIPISPTDPSLPNIVNSIVGKYDVIWAYKCTDTSDPWKQYNPSLPPFLNDLTEMTAEYGYWIDMNSNGTLIVNGTKIETPMNLPLIEGWCLVGMPLVDGKDYSMPNPVSSITGNYEIIWAYHAFDISMPYDPWKQYNPSLPPFLNDLTDMNPEFGYWIKMLANDTLVIE